MKFDEKVEQNQREGVSVIRKVFYEYLPKRVVNHRVTLTSINPIN